MAEGSISVRGSWRFFSGVDSEGMDTKSDDAGGVSLLVRLTERRLGETNIAPVWLETLRREINGATPKATARYTQKHQSV